MIARVSLGMFSGAVCVMAACHAGVAGPATAEPPSIPPARIPVAPLAPPAADLTAGAPGEDAAAAPDAGPPACPDVDPAKAAPFDLDTKVLGVPPPPIVDPAGVLAPFYDRLAALARGDATDHVRIGFYGDSNMTRDYITGAMRRALAARFGDAGHGFVALGRPWPWYLHEDVRHDVDLKTWQMFATSTHHAPDGFYGFANIAAEASVAGATTWVRTAEESAPIGKTVSRIDVYFLKRPAGGSFRIKIDGQLIKTVSTASTAFEAGFEAIDVPDAPHLLECVAVGDGRVRLFGAVLERAPAPGAYGVVVDSLGVGALNFEQMQHVDSKTRIAMLAHRKYDLVAFLLGTNMFAPELHATWVRNVLADFRAALPNTPILIMSPPDIVLDSADLHSDPRIVRLARQMKAIAAEQGAAFWDFRDAMGGDASIQAFIRRGLASTDHVHLTPAGGAVMGNRVVVALFDGFRRWLEAHPRAGCPGEVVAPLAVAPGDAGVDGGAEAAPTSP
jgi:lysophospholipase L1-like esterase